MEHVEPDMPMRNPEAAKLGAPRKWEVWGWGLGAGGLGAPGPDGQAPLCTAPKPVPPGIRKRSACGFPQGDKRATSARFQ